MLIITWAPAWYVLVLYSGMPICEAFAQIEQQPNIYDVVHVKHFDEVWFKIYTVLCLILVLTMNTMLATFFPCFFRIPICDFLFLFFWWDSLHVKIKNILQTIHLRILPLWVLLQAVTMFENFSLLCFFYAGSIKTWYCY